MHLLFHTDYGFVILREKMRFRQLKTKYKLQLCKSFLIEWGVQTVCDFVKAMLE